MSKIYSEGHRAFQDQFDSRKLADGLEQVIVHDSVAGKDRPFIENSDMFFLSTIDGNGWPTVSYKGGYAGFVKIVDDQTLAFPIYDGNGMFYSTGNISEYSKIGMLFIDFEQPRRLRVHGTASVSSKDPLIGEYHEACLVVRVKIDNIFVNCARYIHKYTKQMQSINVPEAGLETPIADWKRIEEIQDILPGKDKGAAEKAGGTIPERDYQKEFWRGLD